MKKITLEEFVDIINNATKTGETSKFRIREYNAYNIFSVVVNQESVILRFWKKANMIFFLKP